MSIFNRLITSLTGSEEVAAPAPTPAAAQAQPEAPVSEASEDVGSRRFMGRDKSEVEAPPVEKGLPAPAMLWIHIQPATQRLFLVPELGVAEGEELNPTMMADLRRAGWCEEVAYHAGYDQYWKMPSQEAILRTPSLYEIPMPLLNRVKLETRLVKHGEPRGFWMRVRMRTNEELGPSGDAALV